METGKVVQVAGFKIQFAEGLTGLTSGCDSRSKKVSRVPDDTIVWGPDCGLGGLVTSQTGLQYKRDGLGGKQRQCRGDGLSECTTASKSKRINKR